MNNSVNNLQNYNPFSSPLAVESLRDMVGSRRSSLHGVVVNSSDAGEHSGISAAAQFYQNANFILILVLSAVTLSSMALLTLLPTNSVNANNLAKNNSTVISTNVVANISNSSNSNNVLGAEDTTSSNQFDVNIDFVQDLFVNGTNTIKVVMDNDLEGDAVFIIDNSDSQWKVTEDIQTSYGTSQLIVSAKVSNGVAKLNLVPVTEGNLELRIIANNGTTKSYFSASNGNKYLMKKSVSVIVSAR